MTIPSIDKQLCPHCHNHQLCLDYGYNPPEPYCLSCGWRLNPPPDMFVINYPAISETLNYNRRPYNA